MPHPLPKPLLVLQPTWSPRARLLLRSVHILLRLLLQTLRQESLPPDLISTLAPPGSEAPRQLLLELATELRLQIGGQRVHPEHWLLPLPHRYVRLYHQRIRRLLPTREFRRDQYLHGTAAHEPPPHQRRLVTRQLLTHQLLRGCRVLQQPLRPAER